MEMQARIKLIDKSFSACFDVMVNGSRTILAHHALHALLG